MQFENADYLKFVYTIRILIRNGGKVQWNVRRIRFKWFSQPKLRATISAQIRVSEEDKSLWEARESALEQKIEDGSDKILKFESYWLETQALCKSVNEQLGETQAQYETLDKKYNKAKKLLKDYQQK